MSRPKEIAAAILATADRPWPKTREGMDTAAAILLGHLSTIAEDAPVEIAERLLVAVDRAFPAASVPGGAS